MSGASRAVLYTIAALTFVLGVWGILSNAAVPLMYGKVEWNFVDAFDKWGDPGGSGEHHPKFRFPWWAISW